MPFIALVIALILRLIYLYANASLDLPPVWFSVVHSSLRAAEHFMGVSAEQVQGLMGVPQAINHYLHEMRAGTWLHMADIYIFGQTSLLRLSVLGVLLDSISLVLLYKIALRVQAGASKLSAQRTAWVYALSPLHIFMSIVPSWYTWLNFGVIFLTYLVLCNSRTNTNKNQRLFWWWSLLSAWLVLSVISQYRATMTMLPVFFAMVLFVIYAHAKFKHKQHKTYLKASLWALALGVLVNCSYGLTNKLIVNEFFLGRKHIAHSFLMGLGEQKSSFAQRHGLDGTDSSVYTYYLSEHPLLPKDHEPTVTAFSDLNYRAWSRGQMMSFMSAHPALYIKFYILRVIKQLIPNFRFSLIADVDAYSKLEPEANKSQRLDLIRGRVQVTFERILMLIKNNPVYFLDYILRIAVMIFLPISLLLGLNRFRKKKVPYEEYVTLSIIFVPMMYMVCTLSLIRTPNFDHAAAWSVLMPICILGSIKKSKLS